MLRGVMPTGFSFLQCKFMAFFESVQAFSDFFSIDRGFCVIFVRFQCCMSPFEVSVGTKKSLGHSFTSSIFISPVAMANIVSPAGECI